MTATDTPRRTALLSLEAAPDAPLSGRRKVAGASVVERQVDMALALGCQTVWLHARQQDELALRIQHLVERAGARFRLVPTGRHMLGALTQDDQLVVLAEGLLVTDRDRLEPLRDGPVILRFDAGEGGSHPFERLDRDHAWAGAMVLPGRILEGMGELPEDVAPASALLRAARMARLREETLPSEWRGEGGWGTDLVAPATQSSDEQGGPATPRLGKGLTTRLADDERLSLALGILALLAFLAALASLVANAHALALAAVAASLPALRLWLAARRERDPLALSTDRDDRRERWAMLAPDLVGATALGLGLMTTIDLQSAIYIALLTWISWLIAARLGTGRLASLARREWLWLGAALAGFAGQFFAGAAALTLVALVAIAVRLRKQTAITPV